MRRRLGRPLPHQQADAPRAHPQAKNFTHATRGGSTSGISSGFPLLCRTWGQVTHVLLTRSPLSHQGRHTEAIGPRCFVRLACLRHTASVHPEPGSNSPKQVPDYGSDEPVLQCETESTGRCEPDCQGARRFAAQVPSMPGPNGAVNPAVGGGSSRSSPAVRPSSRAPKGAARRRSFSKSTGRSANRIVKELGSMGRVPLPRAQE